ncbi:MAG: mechanosensitive ion channel [Candidatus Nanohaloarchaeota archaeon QJJ-7]|nr:mechanosensitive ion channel [Candidatus Nanohaloarchaeota archaeon QJJ-7]
MALVGKVLENGWDETVAFLQTESVARPRLFAAIVIAVVGFVGGRIVGELVRKLIGMTSLDELAVKSDVQSFLRQIGYRGSISELIGGIVKWLIYLLTLSSLLYMFGLGSAAVYSQVLLDWGTRFLIAVAIVLIGAAISDQLEQITVRLFRVSRLTGLVDESEAEMPVYVIAGKSVKYTGLLVSLLIALGFAGINVQILNILFGLIGLGIVASLVLGTRDLTRNIAVSVYFQISRVFDAGDDITVGEYSGSVSGIRPLYTKLDSDGKTIYIPNHKLVSETIEREEG